MSASEVLRFGAYGQRATKPACDGVDLTLRYAMVLKLPPTHTPDVHTRSSLLARENSLFRSQLGFGTHLTSR